MHPESAAAAESELRTKTENLFLAHTRQKKIKNNDSSMREEKWAAYRQLRPRTWPRSFQLRQHLLLIQELCGGVLDVGVIAWIVFMLSGQRFKYSAIG